ncbi:MAG: hypothetical protein WDZ45_01035 [Flavobacteriaceae bacterium]
MGFGGSVHAMIVSLKNNKRSRTTLFEKDINKNNGAYTKFTDTKKMSPTEFRRFQEKLKEDRKRSKQKFLLVFIPIVSLLIGLIVYLLFYFKLTEI